MAQLAIKGHPTRSKEVIEILEMLGEKNNNCLNGVTTGLYYFIEDYTIYSCEKVNSNYIIFTLEEFLEKFPYKIGDKAFAFGNKCTIIDAVWCESITEVVYTIILDTSKYTTTKLSNQLQPYKEETMEERGDKSKAPKLQSQDYSGKRFGYRIPNGYEFDCIDNGEMIIKPKQPQYPKTYEECCALLSLGEDGRLYTKGYKARLIQDFENSEVKNRLCMCRIEKRR